MGSKAIGCPFCEPEAPLARTDQVVVIPDAYPVAQGHVLVIPARHVGRVEELTIEERAGLLEAAVAWMGDHPAQGWTLGINDGAAAGQTIDHVHLHLIPRHAGDVPDPRGGVRWVIPARAGCWQGE